MDIRLTELTKSSGWAAKIGPDVLTQVLCQLPKSFDENLLVGLNTSDDAAVYRIDDNLALIQTLDFFTPIVDDPYKFGQIAAANSLSDVYAMGGEPKLAMNIVCFPNCLSPDVLVEILKGGFDKVKEAGALLIGGHTVEDDEPKYGLSVAGFVNPNRVWTNSNAKPGDLLILTKPLGVGIINTAIKGGLADEESYNEAVEVMSTLNKYAKEVIEKTHVNSVTDITGFGLLGHALEMAEGSSVTIVINHKSIPVIKGAIEYAQMGLVPAGAYSNRKHAGDRIKFNSDISEEIKDILYDPQTSGGLLVSVPRENADLIMENLKKTPTEYALIGEVVEKKENYIIVIWKRDDMEINKKLFRHIPKVDEILEDKKIKELLLKVSRKVVLNSIREELEQFREEIKYGKLSESEVVNKSKNIIKNIINRIEEKNSYALKRVINGTGIVIHTNIGRSLISKEVMENVLQIATNYSNLEYDLNAGNRGSRYDHLKEIIKEITGGEDALVVNNNAAAVMLVLSTLAKGKEVIVSRGELIEIGGSFRIPDVMEESGAVLKAVGTTNKTHYKDYENAIDENTAALLKVHTSNYRILGFTSSVSAKELYPLKVKYNLPLIEDLGSGVLIDLSKFGLEYEPTVQDSLKQGVDIVTFSGDKLLGGPQAGVIVGKKEYIDKMKKNPLTRALRVDKFTISALEATLRLYLDENEAIDKIPTLNMLSLKIEDLEKRAKELYNMINEVIDDKDFNIEIVDSYSEVGGGSLPLERIPTKCVKISFKNGNIGNFEKALREFRIPIIGRIYKNGFYLDLRTIRKEEFSIIVDGIDYGVKNVKGCIQWNI